MFSETVSFVFQEIVWLVERFDFVNKELTIDSIFRISVYYLIKLLFEWDPLSSLYEDPNLILEIRQQTGVLNFVSNSFHIVHMEFTCLLKGIFVFSQDQE